jgi:D-alanyl-lipoteichoic acid acyltransferase DltB (MBOAT superfamily)
VAHAYGMFISNPSNNFDYTRTQMVLTMKLTSFAYNLYDGTFDQDNINKDYGNDKQGKIYAERKKYAIEKLPNLLEFYGYIYCFPCILAGPAFEYQDYYKAITGKQKQ